MVRWRNWEQFNGLLRMLVTVDREFFNAGSSPVLTTKKTMATIHRYSKDTIKNQVWETCIIENENNITLSEIHLRRDNCKVIKEVVKQITQVEAENYKERNKQWHIETYNTC